MGAIDINDMNRIYRAKHKLFMLVTPRAVLPYRAADGSRANAT